jgi:hypothetical protein
MNLHTLRAGLALATAFAFPFLSAQPRDVAEKTQLPPAINAPAPETTDGPVIKLALLLDTSNSMDGLINQARTRLWQVVNEMGEARVDGAIPQLQVALFQYGNSGLEEADDFVQMRCPFTTDLDIVSEQLFSLTTNGGAEYCGSVIRESVQRLNWGQSGDAPVLRLIVIAGNEPFNQGTVPYAESISTARGLDVRVNTIFCGNEREGRSTLWADGARLGHGHFSAIDQNQVRPEIETPFDDALRRLNDALNATYRGYGARGAEFVMRQAEQDRSNLAASPSGSFARTAVKASVNYQTSHWDLVSAFEEGKVAVEELEEMEDAALPEELRGKTTEEQEAVLRELAAKRAEIEAEIRAVSAERQTFLAEARRTEADQSVDLADALISALREQGEAVGFNFSAKSE